MAAAGCDAVVAECAPAASIPSRPPDHARSRDARDCPPARFPRGSPCTRSPRRWPWPWYSPWRRRRPAPTTGSRSSRPPTSPTRRRRSTRPYHFGSQGPGDVFSNHASHTNRLVPVYVFGRKADLGAVTGKNSLYRDPAKIKALYGVPPREHRQPRGRVRRPERPLPGPDATPSRGGSSTCSSSGSTASTGRPPRPPRSSRPGKVYTAGKGSGLIFQDYTADGSAQFGYFVTSPTHDKNTPDVDAQTVAIPRRQPRRRLRRPDRRPEPLDPRPARGKGPGLSQGAVGQRRPTRRA